MVDDGAKGLSYEEADILRTRGFFFLEEARRAFNEEKYDFAVFLLEQACQLYVKHKLLVRFGTYPRTHSLHKLLEELAKARETLNEFLKKYSVELGDLEDAYIVSRYMPRRYSKEEARRLLETAEELFKVLRDV